MKAFVLRRRSALSCCVRALTFSTRTSSSWTKQRKPRTKSGKETVDIDQNNSTYHENDNDWHAEQDSFPQHRSSHRSAPKVVSSSSSSALSLPDGQLLSRLIQRHGTTIGQAKYLRLKRMRNINMEEVKGGVKPPYWQPKKKLSQADMALIRRLHVEGKEMAANPYTPLKLAQTFGVSLEAVTRILKSKWRTKEDEAALQRRLGDLGVVDEEGADSDVQVLEQSKDKTAAAVRKNVEKKIAKTLSTAEIALKLMKRKDEKRYLQRRAERFVDGKFVDKRKEREGIAWTSSGWEKWNQKRLAAMDSTASSTAKSILFYSWKSAWYNIRRKEEQSKLEQETPILEEVRDRLAESFFPR